MTGFERLGPISPTILKAVASMGYETPTPVQAAAIPVLLSGRDALVEAETGSGKTTAYGIPVVQVASAARGLRVLVLVPTRELARQVADELRELGTGSPIRTVALTGGLSEEQEYRALYGDTRCVVATPGRLLAVIEEGRVTTDKVDLVVLDEADRMLDMGFRTDVEKILAATANRQQTALLSATLPQGVIRLADAHLRDPVHLKVGGTSIPEQLVHHRLNVMDGQKEYALLALLRKEDPQRAMVFVRTRARALAFTRLLKKAGLAADQLQGNMTHDQRRHVFDLFSRGTTRILVATDLASRGLDVPEMELVINVDLPEDDETYLHRAGRAGRLGRAGRVITLVLPDEKPRRIRFEEAVGAEFAPYRLQFSEADLPKEPEPEDKTPKNRKERRKLERAKLRQGGPREEEPVPTPQTLMRRARREAPPPEMPKRAPRPAKAPKWSGAEHGGAAKRSPPRREGGASTGARTGGGAKGAGGAARTGGARAGPAKGPAGNRTGGTTRAGAPRTGTRAAKGASGGRKPQASGRTERPVQDAPRHPPKKAPRAGPKAPKRTSQKAPSKPTRDTNKGPRRTNK